MIDKFTLITRNLQEHTDSDILKKTVETKNLNVYWGTATTGKPHLGYYVPLLKIRDLVLAECNVTILLADIHAFLDNLKAPIDLVKKRCDYYEKLLKEMLLSIDVDLTKIKFIRGSEFQLSQQYVFDLLKLTTLTTQRNAIKAGAQVVKQVENPLLSSMIYPLMQALDEEYLKADCELGGIDQRKIFMFARKYLPILGYKKRIHLMTPMVPGLSSVETETIQKFQEFKDIKDKVLNCDLQSDQSSLSSLETEMIQRLNLIQTNLDSEKNFPNSIEDSISEEEKNNSKKAQINICQQNSTSSISSKMSSSVESSKIDILDTKKQIFTKISKCYLKPTKDSPLFNTIQQIIMPIMDIKKREFIIKRKEQQDFIFKDFQGLMEAFHEEKIHPSDLKQFISTEIDFIIGPIRENMLMNKEIVEAAYCSQKTKKGKSQGKH